ncbi:MAG: beta-propeller domain-containing protein [Thermoleophilia bacterium]
MRRTTAGILAGLALAVVPATAQAAPGLRDFRDCNAFLDYVQTRASGLVNAYGLYGSWVVYPRFSDVVGPLPVEEAPAAPASDGGTRASAPAPGVDFSGTNVQEAGVDEPDIVKTDGTTIFSVAQGRVWSVSAQGGASAILDSLPVENAWSAQLLLDGTRLLVIGYGSTFRSQPDAAEGEAFLPWLPTTEVTLIDASDPADLKVVQRLSIEGTLVSGRLTGQTARLVVTSGPTGISFAYPEDSTVRARRAARLENREAVEDTVARNWLPLARLSGPDGTPTSTRRLVACADVSRPSVFSGLGLVSVVTLDLTKGLDPVDTDAVLADGSVVYASPDGLYVASQRWFDWARIDTPEELPNRITTAIHKFDTSGAAETAYAASGVVPGYMLSQWAMSESKGFLRVASTSEPAWWTDDGERSQSLVTVLADDGANRLRKTGQVGGLGEGERIYAVRFVGDIGYVVTFRQTDPLYTVDVSDPTAPRVLGELKILGYSAYLHPIGDGLLLGVGQDATAQGRTKGTQLSVFDVSNPAKPVRLAQQTIEDGWSEAEWDHHAFLHWPATSLTMIPVSTYAYDGATQTERAENAAFAFRVGAGGIERLGAIAHLEALPGLPASSRPLGGPSIRRVLVVGGSVYTLSDLGLKASDLATLQAQGFVAFPLEQGDAPVVTPVAID